MFTTYTITNVGQSCHHGHPRHVLNAKSLVLVDWGVHQQDTWASEFQVAMWSIVMDSGTLASQPLNFFTRYLTKEHGTTVLNSAVHITILPCTRYQFCFLEPNSNVSSNIECEHKKTFTFKCSAGLKMYCKILSVCYICQRTLWKWDDTKWKKCTATERIWMKCVTNVSFEKVPTTPATAPWDYTQNSTQSRNTWATILTPGTTTAS